MGGQQGQEEDVTFWVELSIGELNGWFAVQQEIKRTGVSRNGAIALEFVHPVFEPLWRSMKTKEFQRYFLKLRLFPLKPGETVKTGMERISPPYQQKRPRWLSLPEQSVICQQYPDWEMWNQDTLVILPGSRYHGCGSQFCLCQMPHGQIHRIYESSSFRDNETAVLVAVMEETNRPAPARRSTAKKPKRENPAASRTVQGTQEGDTQPQEGAVLNFLQS